MADERAPRGRDRDRNREEVDDGMVEKLIAVNRVSKTVKGGRQFTFTACHRVPLFSSTRIMPRRACSIDFWIATGTSRALP